MYCARIRLKSKQCFNILWLEYYSCSCNHFVQQYVQELWFSFFYSCFKSISLTSSSYCTFVVVVAVVPRCLSVVRSPGRSKFSLARIAICRLWASLLCGVILGVFYVLFHFVFVHFFFLLLLCRENWWPFVVLNYSLNIFTVAMLHYIYRMHAVDDVCSLCHLKYL